MINDWSDLKEVLFSKGFKEITVEHFGTLHYKKNDWKIWEAVEEDVAVISFDMDNVGYFFNRSTGKVELDNHTDATTARFLRHVQAQKFLNKEVYNAIQN
jgi:hypothetical protein